MNEKTEDVLDALLGQSFDGPVPAHDFCERVMHQLPARRRRNTWPLVIGVLAGAVACGLSLWSTPIMQAGWQDWFSGESSASAIALLASMMGMAMLAAAWVMAEADDGFVSSGRGGHGDC